MKDSREQSPVHCNQLEYAEAPLLTLGASAVSSMDSFSRVAFDMVS